MPKFYVRFCALVDSFATIEVESDTAENAEKIARERLEIGTDFTLSDNGIDPIASTIEMFGVENADHESVLNGSPIGTVDLERAIQRQAECGSIPLLTREAAIRFARDKYAEPSDNDIAIPVGVAVSRSGDRGYWVEARVYVRDEETTP